MNSPAHKKLIASLSPSLDMTPKEALAPYPNSSPLEPILPII